MKKIAQLIILLCISLFTFYSCSSEFSGYTKAESGLYYKFHVKTDSTKVNIGDEIIFDLKYMVNDSVIFDTDTRPYPNRREVLEPQYSGDIYECFTLLAVGDSASFIIEADSFFLITATRPSLPPFIQPKSKLYIDVKIQSLIPKKQIETEKKEFKAILKAKESESIKKFKDEQNLNQEFIENTGIFYKTIIKGSGRLPKPADYITVDYTIYTLDGESFFESSVLGNEIIFECKGTNYETEGFNLIIDKMKMEQKTSFLIPSNLAFGEEGLKGRMLPYSPLNYVIEILNIQTKDEYIAAKEAKNLPLINAEIEKISSYVKNNGIQETPRESGLYYIEKEEGSGDLAKIGDEVRVHYTLYDLDGRKLESSYEKGEPFSFVISIDQVIEGWHEALALMKVGGKATLIIPSKIGYKDQRRVGNILPYTPLLFDIELIEIVK